jgi:hypothetical protein
MTLCTLQTELSAYSSSRTKSKANILSTIHILESKALASDTSGSTDVEVLLDQLTDCADGFVPSLFFVVPK